MRRQWAWLAVFLIPALMACNAGEVHHCADGDAPAGPVTSDTQEILDSTAAGRLAGPAFDDSHRSLRVVYLLDYSGSMYGGYDSGRKACTVVPPARPGHPAPRAAPLGPPKYYYGVPQFIDLVTRLMVAATPPGGPVQSDLLLFNQKLWRVTEAGPREFVSSGGLTGDLPASSGLPAFQSRFSKIPNDPYKLGDLSPNETHTSEAVKAVIDALPDEGMIWLLTDNIADESALPTEQADVTRNREFYALLAEDPRVQIAAFYPLHLAEPTAWMCGSSIVVYGLYVSKHERAPSAEVTRMWGMDAQGAGPQGTGLLWNPPLRALYEEFGGKSAAFPDLSGAPMRLKPVDQNVLAVNFVPFRDQDGTERALRCGRASFGEPLKCEARVQVQNTLRHQKVTGATLNLSNLTLRPYLVGGPETELPWASSVCPGEMQVSQWLIQETEQAGQTPAVQLGVIAPLQTRTVQVAFDVPAVTVGHQGLRQLADVALTDAFELRGRLQADIVNVVTALHLDTAGWMDVYGIESLPTSFREQKTERLRIEGPARARLSNDGQRLALMTIGLLVFILLAVIGFGFVFQRVYYTVRVDNVEHARIKLRRLGRYSIDIRGRQVARVVRNLGGIARLVGGNGWRLRADGSHFIASRSDGRDTEEHRLELTRGWGARTNRGSGTKQRR